MKNNTFLKIAVLSMFFVQMGVGTITPAIANIAAAYPDIPFTTLLLVSTLAVLMSVPATLISGRIAGTVVKYKTLLLIGMILFIGGGVAPYFMATSSFTAILAVRAIFGIGLGIVTPLGGALIIAFFDGEVRAQMMGFGNVVANVGGILFQLLGGMAAGIAWQYAFLPHALGVITLVLILFLPEPEKAPVQVAGEAKPKLPGSVFGFALAIFLITALVYPMLVNMSTIIAVTGMGGAADAALVLTMFTIGGMAGGFIFAKVFGIFKKNTFAVGLAMLAIAMVSVGLGNSILFMYIGTTAAGVGFSFIMPTIFMDLGAAVHPSQMATASGIVMACMNIGGFCSAYIFAFLGSITGMTENIKFPFYVSMTVFAVAAIAYLLIKPKQPETPQPE
ncbi:MFS transporter [Acetobacterium sp.]|jgi:MFS family permease|uniref:MFS transporter n=1 Tax=Acetobacterium sp. TaxID=1872094 RepID=UPI000CA944CC|nr:MFS transporter [Acetobacterium sp.]MDO9493676.1 MFS transporter [Acetobacterium sp.]PKM71472.1 MAG: MFS transporter [Firmicutes bacterium HGW-Firmicutes-17]